MAKKDHSEEIVKVTGINLPAFMTDDGQAGVESLSEFITPPRIKIVQKQAMSELLAVFHPGDVILSPMNATVLEMPRDESGRPKEGERVAFKLVPIFFYPEWVTWNPIELKGKESAIRYRTVDPTDPVVVKSRNAETRSEPHPDDPKLRIRHVEHLNFVVMLYDSHLGPEPAILSFARGEHSAGTKFAALIKMRKAPIYGGIYEAVVVHRHGELGDWYGFDMTNPQDGNGWVREADYTIFKAAHAEFEEYHRSSRLQSRLEDDALASDSVAAIATDDF